MELPQLIEALCQPAVYPYPVEAVEVRQTHISAVFLAGSFVYKIKKPVSPGFLDFTTLEKRRHFCEEEVRLNRRLAPQIYLGVVPVVQTARGVYLEREGEIIEWAVKMRRLPDGATLQERLRRGEVGVELVEALAQRIATFHHNAESNPRITTHGRFEAVAGLVHDVFARAAPAVGTTVSREVFARVRALTEEALSRLAPLIASRADRGLVRDCHGDLHLDHVYAFPDQPPPDDLVIIDCIEFNERFRCLDPVADMAFPVMDFAFLGRRDLGRAFADAYFRVSGDVEGRALLPLYTAYRAMVRGMVEGLLLTEKEVPAAEQAAARVRAQAHWLLALVELQSPGRRPCLLLVAGLPGSGKSRLAQGLAERAGFEVVRSDVVRKELAGLPVDQPTPVELRTTLYTPEWHERTYTECRRRAEHLLMQGKRVVVDATFRTEDKRRTFLDTAVTCGVPMAILLCQAEPETVRCRLAERRGDASDADWAVNRSVAEHWETMGPDTRRCSHAISTEGTPEDALERALDVLRQLGLWE